MTTTYISDAFTAANGTAINGRTPDITVSSRTWTAGDWAGGTLGTVDIQGNKARMSSANDGFSIDVGQADFIAICNVTTPSSFATAFRGGIRFRCALQADGFGSASDRDYYFFVVRFDLGTGQIRIGKFVDGSETVLGTDANYSFSTSTAYKVTLKAEGSTYTVYIDDVQQKQETDSTYTTQTIMGVSAGGTIGQDYLVDDITVTDIAAGTAVPVFYHQLQQQGIS